jgi:hypothetical protein
MTTTISGTVNPYAMPQRHRQSATATANDGRIATAS